MKMKPKLSLLMITKNAEETIQESLMSVKKLVDEIVIIDDYSTDKTSEIARQHGAKIFFHKESDLGKQRKYGLSKVNGEWVLALDSDEVISKELAIEITNLKNSNFHLPAGGLNSKSQKNKKVTSDRLQVTGFYIYFQNHLLDRPLHYGGENYKKLWFFKKNCVIIEPALVHENFKLKKGKSGILKNKIYHYSYKSISQMYKKFTDYSFREARQKALKGEKCSFKKIFLYPIHMFWVRFIKDKGYRDGLFRLPLDLGFAYMEFLTYVLLWVYSWRKSNIKYQISK